MITSSKYVEGTYRVYLPQQEAEYRCFIPPEVTREFVISNKVSSMCEEAMRLVGELNAYSSFVPDVDYFIGMHVRKEALQSSRIEGTNTDIDEALMKEADVQPEKRDDWREVQNYILAMNKGIALLNELPLSMRLLNETHKLLLQGVRGEGKFPGEIRTTQNWIGGASLKTALFVPPHADHIGGLLSDLEKFWHNKSLALPQLIKIAVSHYQFETIHPYVDGNGRIGRLLITLQLTDQGILSRPTLYISDFFERHRQAYYDALTLVRRHANLDHWLEFFLEAVIDSASSSKEKFESIMELRHTYNERILSLGGRAKKANELLSALYTDPVVSIADVGDIVKLAPPNANKLVADLVELGILKEITGFSRNRIFRLDDYVKIFRG